MGQAPNVKDEAAHLDAFKMPDFGGNFEDADGPQAVGEDGEVPDPDAGRITEDEFWEAFQLAFAMPGMIQSDFEPLAIQPKEMIVARPASRAAYRLIEIWSPGILDRGNTTLALVAQIIPFAFLKFKVVQMVMQERLKIARAAAERPAGAAGATFQRHGAAPRANRPVAPMQGEGPLTFNGPLEAAAA